MGDFPTICHNEICDITASLLTEVCNNVATKPPLQPLSGESMTARSANTDDGARVDIHASGFWNASRHLRIGKTLGTRFFEELNPEGMTYILSEAKPR